MGVQASRTDGSLRSLPPRGGRLAASVGPGGCSQPALRILMPCPSIFFRLLFLSPCLSGPLPLYFPCVPDLSSGCGFFCALSHVLWVWLSSYLLYLPLSLLGPLPPSSSSCLAPEAQFPLPSSMFSRLRASCLLPSASTPPSPTQLPNHEHFEGN